jgi:hypothetical protein
MSNVLIGFHTEFTEDAEFLVPYQDDKRKKTLCPL